MPKGDTRARGLKRHTESSVASGLDSKAGTLLSKNTAPDPRRDEPNQRSKKTMRLTSALGLWTTAGDHRLHKPSREVGEVDEAAEDARRIELIENVENEGETGFEEHGDEHEFTWVGLDLDFEQHFQMRRRLPSH